MAPTAQANSETAWKQRFRLPRLLWTDVARSAPTRGLAVTNQSGVYQLYGWHVATGELHQLTHSPAGKMWGSLSPDGRFVYFHDDHQGNEIGHLTRVPFEGGEYQDVTPALPPYSTNAWHINRMGNRLALNVATRTGFDLHLINLESLDESQLIWHSDSFTADPVLSADGRWIVWHITERSSKMKYSLLVLSVESRIVMKELYDGAENSLIVTCFSPLVGDERILARTNRSGHWRPFVWNPLTDERRDLLVELDGDVIPLDWSDDGQSILMCQSNQAQQQLYCYMLDQDKLIRLDHPSGSFGQWSIAYFVGNEIFAHREDSTQPLRVVALDARTGVQTRVVLSTADAPMGHAWQSVAFPSRDGVLIQGWLGLPEQTAHGPFPAILHMHGGPFTAQTDEFHPLSQAWIDHGFAFLSINYRGSTTFGSEFQDKIQGHPGQWEVEDIVAARDWLVQDRIAEPTQIFLTGGSYGGYLTLLALGKYPDLWAGGIAQRAIADWAACYEDEKDTHRAMQVALFGGTPQTKPEQHAVSSPITYLDRIQAPMLVIQARNDTRTPARQLELFAAKAESIGKTIKVHWYDAGHMGISVDQEIKHMELMLQFAQGVKR
jgi:dipeptidyl aminopeptidase/acylaminoacyl peptidase